MRRKGMRQLGVLMLIAVLLLITACGSNGSNSGTPGAQPAGASSNNAAPLVVKITSCTTHDPITYSMEQFKQKLEAKADGRFKVEVYPSCQLGSSDQMVQQVIAGNVQIFVTPTAFLSGVEPFMTVIDLPYLYPDVRAATEYLNTEGKLVLEGKLNAKGISALGFYEYGPRIVLSKREVKSLADFKGLKVRTMQSPVLSDQINAFGGAGVPMGVPELYTAIQQGTVDGIESGAGFFYSGKYYENAKFIINEPKGALVSVFATSKKWLDGLPEDLRKAVTETAHEITNDVNTYSRTDYDNSMKKMQEAGLKVIETSPEFHEELVEASEQVYTKLYARVPGSKEWIDQIKTKFAK